MFVLLVYLHFKKFMAKMFMYRWDPVFLVMFLFSSLTGKYHNISNATVKLLEALRGNGKHILGIERRNIELSKKYNLTY